MPRAGTPFVHPDLEESLSDVGWQNAICTIEEKGAQRDEFGEVTGDWVFLAGHELIPCRIASVTGSELRRPDMTIVQHTHNAKLEGHWPDIKEEMRAVVNDLPYNIDLVQHDSSETTTYLRLIKAKA